MRFVPVLAAAAFTFSAACDKKKGGDATGGAADPVATATDKADKPAEPAKPKPPGPIQKTGVLDVELQQVDGGWKVLTPRVSQLFTSKPTVQRQDAQTPFGDTVPGAVALVEGGDRFAGLIYIPIPKDLPYDVPKGLKGARDGMLGMFDPGYTAKDEKSKLGPLEANHVIAEGSREGHRFHVEAWIAYDEGGHSVYGLMALRMPSDLSGIDKLVEGFTIREDAKPAEAPPAQADDGKPADGADKKADAKPAAKKDTAKAAAPKPAPAGDAPL